ncbi:MAG: DegT/DnrJ/EryC1/StrS family aminotransferase [Sulfuricellaceae bacterium]|nr:DegT/DnrJ/EryC1/StrS family aminotransferase [Sulfuricellaceae bacterium]
MTPKQIIYPINYTRALFGASSALTEVEQFRKVTGGMLGGGVELIPLGRARMGIYLLVKQAIRGGKNKVILSPYTIPDVINMVVLAGGEPVFVDFVHRSTNVDVSHLEGLIADNVACVLVTHYHVNQNDFYLIKALCERKGVYLFEDCAISLSGKIDNKHVGTESDGAILSLSGFKFLNYFWGGCVFSRHKAIFQALETETREWRRLDRWDYLPQVLKTLKYDLATRYPFFDWAVFPLIKLRQRRSAEAVNLSPPRLESVAIDATLESLPSASALAEWNGKFSTVGRNLQHRRRVAAIYDQYLLEHVVAGETDKIVREGSCFVNYPIYVGQPLRNGIYKNLILSGYDIGASLYPNCHEHDKFADAKGKSSNVRDLVRSVITLPTHPRVSEHYAHVLGRTVAQAIGA